MARGTTTLTTTLALLSTIGAAVALTAGRAEAATPTYYNNLAAFQVDVTNTVTDTYSNPAYVFIQNNAVMSAVIGETDYTSTGHANLKHRVQRPGRSPLLCRLQRVVRAVVPDDQRGQCGRRQWRGHVHRGP
jgi:hypothetical protein